MGRRKAEAVRDQSRIDKDLEAYYADLDEEKKEIEEDKTHNRNANC